MYERTLRRLLIVGFALLCVAPTILTVVWAVSHQTVWYRLALERKLSDQWGERVSIEQLRFPRPRQILLNDLQVRDWETDAQLGHAKLVEVHRGQRGWLIHVLQPTIELSHLDTYWNWLDRRLMRWDQWSTQDVELSAQDVTLHTTGTATSRTLRDLHCRLSRESDAPSLTAAFQFAGSTETSRAQLKIRRTREMHSPSTTFELNCPTPVPCALFGDKAIATLGGAATFAGKIIATRERDAWAIDIAGTSAKHPAILANVSLWSLVGGRFAHTRLEGQAAVQCQLARVRGNQLVHFDGNLTSQQGRIGWAFLQSVAKAFHLELTVLESPAETISFSQLALHARLTDAAGGYELLLEPIDDDAKLPMVRMMDSRAILTAPSSAVAVPTTRLVSVLAPESRIHVPATPQTNWLLSRLPSPAIVPPDNKTPSAVIRVVAAEKEVDTPAHHRAKPR